MPHFVDLTQDDDSMRGGVQLSRRLEFDTTTTTSTNATTGPTTVPVPVVPATMSVPPPPLPVEELKEEETVAVNQATSSPPDAAMHEFAEGDELFAEVINGDEHEPQFCRCQIIQLLPDGNYWVRFEDGDEFAVAPEYLYSTSQMEARGAAATAPTSEAPNEKSENPSGCVVM
ncbi:hypothetical protein PINS_up002447 [Pythium insidiosum]|nr:hypothetical protein PINS_up002447 [Pythium insidiosum]